LLREDYSTHLPQTPSLLVASEQFGGDDEFIAWSPFQVDVEWFSREVLLGEPQRLGGRSGHRGKGDRDEQGDKGEGGGDHEKDLPGASHETPPALESGSRLACAVHGNHPSPAARQPPRGSRMVHRSDRRRKNKL